MARSGRKRPQEAHFLRVRPAKPMNETPFLGYQLQISCQIHPGSLGVAP
jgi:hypothetical protein